MPHLCTSCQQKGLVVKFPRTPHIPGSRGTSDDIYQPYTYDGEVIATEKMDGSNIMMNSKKFITRSGKSGFDGGEWVWPANNVHIEIAQRIPHGYWIAGELLYWRKGTSYENLPGPYMVFGAMKGNTCLAWDDVLSLAEECGLPVVPVIGSPGHHTKVIGHCMDIMDGSQEGFVIRPTEAFPLPHYGDFASKWVHPNHTSVATNNGVNGVL